MGCVCGWDTNKLSGIAATKMSEALQTQSATVARLSVHASQLCNIYDAIFTSA